MSWEAQASKDGDSGIWRVVEEESTFKLRVSKKITGAVGGVVPDKLVNWLTNQFLPKVIKTAMETYMVEELSQIFPIAGESSLRSLFPSAFRVAESACCRLEGQLSLLPVVNSSLCTAPLVALAGMAKDLKEPEVCRMARDILVSL